MRLFEAIKKIFFNLFKKREMKVWEICDEKLPESETECPHQWKYIKCIYKNSFDGIKFRYYRTSYRICEKCGIVQENFDEWETLSISDAKILKELISKKVIIDADDYYKFPENPEEIEEIEIDIE